MKPIQDCVFTSRTRMYKSKLAFLILGATLDKLPMGRKIKEPEKMCLLIRPRTVGRKPRECHRVKREYHRILPNDPSLKRVQNGLLVNRCLRDWPALFVRSVQSVDGRAEIIYLWLVFSITTQEKHLMQSIKLTKLEGYACYTCKHMHHYTLLTSWFYLCVLI